MSFHVLEPQRLLIYVHMSRTGDQIQQEIQDGTFFRAKKYCEGHQKGWFLLTKLLLCVSFRATLSMQGIFQGHQKGRFLLTELLLCVSSNYTSNARNL